MSSHYTNYLKPEYVQDAFNVKHPEGTMNPIRRKVVTRSITIDSLFRSNYIKTQSTDCLYVLPTPINNVVSMKVAAIEMPNMLHSFSTAKQNNTFKIDIYQTPLAQPKSHTITLPSGNYDSMSFTVAINSFFKTTLNGLENLVAYVDPITSRTIIRTATNRDVPPVDVSNSYPNFKFNLDFTVGVRPLYMNMGWMMGFRDATYSIDMTNTYTDYTQLNSTATTFYKGYLMSESSYGSSVQQYMFIDIDDFNKNFVTDTITTNSPFVNSGRNLIGRFAITSGSNTNVQNTSADAVFKQREYFGPVKIERLHIRILDRFCEVVDINKNDYSLLLEFEQIYA